MGHDHTHEIIDPTFRIRPCATESKEDGPLNGKVFRGQ